MDLPSFTKTYHQKSYPAISPLNQHLSLRGKNVIITGAGAGIGRATAIAFSTAGASNVFIIGRKRSPLEETQKAAESAATDSKTKIHIFVADITDEAGITALFGHVSQTVGSIDIFVANAGALPSPTGTIDMDIADAWFSFEVNVKGTMILTRAYLQHVAAQQIKDPIYINVISGMAWVTMPGSGVYGAGKAASMRLIESAQLNHPAVRFINLQPALVVTDMGKKSGVQGSWDEVDLPGHFMVWLSSSEAAFLKGRLVFSNWDVDEMKAKKAEIEKDPALLTLTLAGWQNFEGRSPILFK